jgi:hypothetical protein
MDLLKNMVYHLPNNMVIKDMVSPKNRIRVDGAWKQGRNFGSTIEGVKLSAYLFICLFVFYLFIHWIIFFCKR